MPPAPAPQLAASSEDDSQQSTASRFDADDNDAAAADPEDNDADTDDVDTAQSTVNLPSPRPVATVAAAARRTPPAA
jgi:hypothetical protein